MVNVRCKLQAFEHLQILFLSRSFLNRGIVFFDRVLRYGYELSSFIPLKTLIIVLLRAGHIRYDDDDMY